jgi:hypothetical protein
VIREVIELSRPSNACRTEVEFVRIHTSGLVNRYTTPVRVEDKVVQDREPEIYRYSTGILWRLGVQYNPGKEVSL